MRHMFTSIKCVLQTPINKKNPLINPACLFLQFPEFYIFYSKVIEYYMK